MAEDRIQNAWKRCSDWVADYDGSATETYFLDISDKNLITALNSIWNSSCSFAFAPIWKDEEKGAVTEVVDMVRLLQNGDLANCAVDFVTSEPGFELSIRLIVDRIDSGLFDADAVWWSDAVFTTGIDSENRFRELVTYFLELHETFHSSSVFIGPENLVDPREQQSLWLEI